MKNSTLTHFVFRCLILSILIGFSTNTYAQSANSAPEETETADVFDVKHLLFTHVGNDFEFHIITYKGKPITVPLPIIVYSSEKGLCAFMSSKFHHKTSAYNGFSIVDGSIVEQLADGSTEKPIDLSITKNVFSVLLACLIIFGLMRSLLRSYKRSPLQAPRGVQAILEPVILFIKEEVAEPVLGERTKKYLPYLLTLFFFILTLNLMGLIPVFPFGANVTGNINVTLCLALCTFIITMCSTNKSYWVHKLWTPGVPVWLKAPIPLMPLVEMISVLTAPLALTVRLFANMLSGHMVVLVLMSLIFIFSKAGPLVDGGVSIVAVVFSVFMLALDVLVSFIQAYVFTLLTALYFGGAKVESEH